MHAAQGISPVDLLLSFLWLHDCGRFEPNVWPFFSPLAKGRRATALEQRLATQPQLTRFVLAAACVQEKRAGCVFLWPAAGQGGTFCCFLPADLREWTP